MNDEFAKAEFIMCLVFGISYLIAQIFFSRFATKH
jgi:hypothetical protein